MTKNCVFRLPQNSIDTMIQNLELRKMLSNDRTTIYQNDDMRFCVDEKVVRVLVYDENNNSLIECLRNYFYGDAYERL